VLLFADMNGIGPEEVVVIAARTSPGAFEIAQPYVDIYSYSEGDWQRVFDSSTFVQPGEMDPLIPESEVGAENQFMAFRKLVDLDGDGAKELVLAKEWFGASGGPLSLWIVQLDGRETQVPFSEETTRGGTVDVVDDKIILKTGSYLNGDPCVGPRTWRPRKSERKATGHSGFSTATDVRLRTHDTRLR
jgi:hypothetical protein